MIYIHICPIQRFLENVTSNETCCYMGFSKIQSTFQSVCVALCSLYVFSKQIANINVCIALAITTHMKSMNNVSVDYYKANANTSQAYICIVKQRNYMPNLLTPPLFELQKD
jgi:hypothetical protein